jgi:hypothetical protein
MPVPERLHRRWDVRRTSESVRIPQSMMNRHRATEHVRRKAKSSPRDFSMQRVSQRRRHRSLVSQR